MVLLISEDPGLATALDQVLHAAGYGLEVARRGDAALTRLRGGLRPTLLLMDSATSRAGGAVVLEALRREPALRSIKAIVFATSPADVGPGVVSLGTPITREAVLALVRRDAQTFSDLPRVGPIR